jgi:hypothetical protein
LDIFGSLFEIVYSFSDGDVFLLVFDLVSIKIGEIEFISILEIIPFGYILVWISFDYLKPLKLMPSGSSVFEF